MGTAGGTGPHGPHGTHGTHGTRGARDTPGGPHRPSRCPRLVEAALAALLGLWGAFQNLWRLGSANLASDEPTYALAGWQYVHGTVEANLEHPFTAKYLIGLSQLVFGPGVTGARVAAAAATLATGVLLWWWARQEAGPWAGLLAAGLWLLLPRWLADWGPRFDRFAMLDPFLAFFATLALYAGWRWARTGRYRWAVAAGAALGLAATTKASGAVLAPVVAVAGLLLLRSWRALAQSATVAVVAAATALATYLGAGGPVGPVRYMLDYQGRHNEAGHLVDVAGRLTAKPPWWANLWYAEQAYGAVLTAVLVLAVLAAVVLRRDLLVGWICAGAGALLVFYCVIADVALPFYYLAWQPEVALLAALGITELARRAAAGNRPRPVRRPAAAATAVLLAACGVAAARTSVATAQVRPHGAARLAAVLAREGASGQVLATGFYRWELPQYLDRRRLLGRPPADPSRVTAIAVHPPRPRSPQDPAVLAFVAANRARLRHVDVDEVDLYVVHAPLAPPSRSQAAPPG